MKLAEITEKVAGVLDGDGELEITGISGLAEAGEGDLSFLANSKYAALLASSRASAVIVSEDWDGESPSALVRVKSPDKAMALAAALLGPPCGPVVEVGVHRSAVVSEQARVDPTARIGPLCVVEPGAVIGPQTVLVAGCYVGRDAVIGAETILRANAVVRERVTVGDRVILHEGSVVGGDGFGNYLEDGAWRKIPHIGTVEIGDDSEIGANTTVDRARFGKTVVGKGVKIDNLVMLGHNVKVGDHSAMAAQVGISGSTTIGKYVMLGGQAGLAGHLEVGDGAIVGAKAGVSKSIQPKSYVTGYPAMPHRKAAEGHANLMRMGTWKERVKELEARLAAMEARLGDGASSEQQG
ncbi:MAG: UDP-3-O-(3-hydroxymyristoyl)glucosamine N-acyltransferase [Fusobacteriaceae bacterium]